MENDKDILVGRHDPNALKVSLSCHVGHSRKKYTAVLFDVYDGLVPFQGVLLRMATEHRTEILAKRGNTSHFSTSQSFHFIIHVSLLDAPSGEKTKQVDEYFPCLNYL